MLTQKFPFLIPLRAAQRKVFYYAGMRLDGRRYAQTVQEDLLPHTLFCSDSGLYNTQTGFDMLYQENKVFNLKLAARQLHGLLIRPGESFSLWQRLRQADRHTPYKDGLVVRNGVLGVAYGGGMCQMSNLLFWVFLHSPLTVVERHTHKVKDFPTMRDTEPEGVDATIVEGWLDLKVKNDTGYTFQIGLSFSDTHITGSLLADRELPTVYEIEDRDLMYLRERDKVHQQVAIYRRELDQASRQVRSEELLYTNWCEIGYPLPEDTPVTEQKNIQILKGEAGHGQKNRRHLVWRLFGGTSGIGKIGAGDRRSY